MTSAVAVLITIAARFGFIPYGLPHQAELPPLSLGFVSLITKVTAPIASFVKAEGGAHSLAHRLSRRTFYIAFGSFLLAVSLRFVMMDDLNEPGFAPGRPGTDWEPVDTRVQQQPVGAHFPALVVLVEETHAEETVRVPTGLSDERHRPTADQSRRPRRDRA